MTHSGASAGPAASQQAMPCQYSPLASSYRPEANSPFPARKCASAGRGWGATGCAAETGGEDDARGGMGVGTGPADDDASGDMGAGGDMGIS